MTIHIDQNSDCAEELDALKTMLKKSKRYLYEVFSYKDIVAIAVDELYDRLVAEAKAGENQRSI